MRGRKAWSRKLGALMMALALCLGVLPATALATGENSWKHTSHDNGWTELTANALGQNGYSLSTGKYYLSGTDYGGGTYFLDLKQTTPIISKKPVNPGKSRDRGTEFTTKLLLLD